MKAMNQNSYIVGSAWSGKNNCQLWAPVTAQNNEDADVEEPFDCLFSVDLQATFFILKAVITGFIIKINTLILAALMHNGNLQRPASETFLSPSQFGATLMTKVQLPTYCFSCVNGGEWES